MGQSRRARVLARFDGMCAYPGCDVRDSLQIDHTIPLELGGADEDHNLKAICVSCHKRKTRLDVKMIAKARRIRKRDAGEGRMKAKIPSRPFAEPSTPVRIPSRPFGRKVKEAAE
jgi:5-methylcytosine-specific restriction endonuclease McrA